MRTLPVSLVLLLTATPAFGADKLGAERKSVEKAASCPVARGRAAQDAAWAVAWEYHHNRNSLRETLRVPGGFLSLTEAGNLLLFDEELRVVRKEYFGPVAITSLASDGEHAVAGFADGRIMTVDPTNLALAKLASVPGGVQWLGHGSAGWVVVHQARGADSRRRRNTEMLVTDLANHRTHSIPVLWAAAFLLDRKNRLWVGEDRGEWGGAAHWLDLGSGKLHDVSLPGQLSNNVYGFTELATGEVVAFGGVLHMSLRSWYVTRVDTPLAQALWSGDNLKRRHPDAGAPDPDQPALPITHVLRLGTDDLLVFSFSDAFRVDRGFKRWRRIASLRLRYFPGRPDAVGSYPALRTVQVLDEREGKLLLVTGDNGHVLLIDGKTAERALPDQLGLRFQESAIAVAAGFFLLPRDDREIAWMLDGSRWRQAEAPPFRLSVLDAFARAMEKDEGDDPLGWSRVRLAVSPKGMLYVFSEAPWVPGTRAVDRWENGKLTPVATTNSALSVEDYFFAPSDELWARDHDCRFQHLENGGWQNRGAAGTARGEPEQCDFLWNLRLLGGGKPPWLYLDPRGKSLMRFHPGQSHNSPAMERVPIGAKGGVVKVNDAMADSDGMVLLASDSGLFRYAPAARTLTPTEWVPEGEPVRALARDGRGRLWSIGRNLRFVPEGQSRARVVRDLPVFTDDARLLGPWPGHPEGVAIGLDERGVLFVEAVRAQ